MHAVAALTWVLVGACVAVAADYNWGIIPVWQPGVVYKYEVHTRTVVGMTPPPSQLNGMVTRAVLLIQTDPRAQRLLKVKVAEAQYSRLHTRVAGPWDAPLPSKELRWRALPLRHPVFALRLRGGQIYRLLVKQDTPLREINIIRALAGALQFSLPHDALSWGLTYELKSHTVLEESPMGECITRIDVSSVPPYVVQSTPSLAPILTSDTKNDTQFLEIVKTIDFDHCTQMPIEWMGGGSAKSYEKGPVTRAAITTAVFGGRPDHFEIQSVTATSRVAAGTLLRGDGRESVVWGGVNITLVSKDEHPRQDVPLLRYAMNVSLIVNGPIGSNKDIYGFSDASSAGEAVAGTRPRPGAVDGVGADAGADGDADEDDSLQTFSQVGESGSNTHKASTLYSQVIDEYLREMESNLSRYAYPAHSPVPKSRADSDAERQYYESLKSILSESTKTSTANGRGSDKWRQGSVYSFLKGKSGYYRILQKILELACKHPEEISSHIRRIIEKNDGFSNETSTTNNDQDQPSNPYAPEARFPDLSPLKLDAHLIPGYSLLKHFIRPSESSQKRSMKSSRIITNWDDMEKLWNTFPPWQRKNTDGNKENSQSRQQRGQLQVSAEEQRYRDKLDFQTMVLLATDPDFAGAKEICPKLVIVQTALLVAEDVEHPNQLVRRRALQRFGELARMVRGCTQAALIAVGEELRRARAPRGRNAWKAFRDATAAAGTGASLVALSTWLRSGAVKGWEARQLLATVRGAAREPSLDYLLYFTKYIAWQNDIQEMDGVNTTAILTLGSLIYDVRDRLPDSPMLHLVSHFVFGMFTSVMSGDRLRLQVFARGLGLTGHDVVPHVFSPYFEGLMPNITTYSRVALVVALQRMAALRDEVTQRMLFNLYENVAEAYEVRVAAVYILMCSNPPLDVLQRMAATAHRDPSNQVSAAVRTVLQAAAQLKQPQMRELARNARAVLHTLLRRTQSVHYSRSYLKDHFMFGEKGLGYSLAFNYIGSYESIIPKVVYFGLNSYLGGLKLGSSEFAIALSSLRTLIATLGDQKSERDQQRGPGPKFPVGPFTLGGVTSLGPRIEEPLEGHIYFPSPGGPQFVNFNEDNVLSITEDLIVQATQFLFNQEFHNSKLFHGSRYSYSVPDITGHITFFNIDEINLLRSSGDASLIREEVVSRNRYNSRQEHYIMSGFKFSTNITHANTMMSRLGFVCFYDGEPQRILAAYDQEYMFNLPINFTAGMYTDVLKVPHFVLRMKPWSSENQTLMHFKGTPYTARQSPDAQGPGYEKEALLVSARDPQEYISDFGPNGGFRFNLTSEAEFLDAVECAKGRAGYDTVALLFLPLARPQLEPLEGTLTFDPRKAKFKAVDLEVNFTADESATPLTPSPGAPQQPSTRSRTSDSKAAGDENLKVEMGILMSFYDKSISHIFESEYKADFRRKNETLGLHYFYKEYDEQKTETPGGRTPEQELHLTVKSQWGDAPRWMFDEALAANPKSTVSGKLLYVDSEQKKMDIDFQCTLSRTPERVSYLESDRAAVLCREQMARGDLFQPACLNVTLRAGYLDHYRCEAEFDRLEPAFLNLTAAAYARARDLFEPHVRENPLHRGEPGRAQAEVRFADGFHAADVALSGPSFAARFEKLRMTRQVRPFVVVHPEYDYPDRVRQYRFVNENEPKCVLDKTTVNTFDNTTYNIRLGPCWHNMSILTMRGIGNMTIQARDSGDERILRVLFPEGSELELRKSQRFYRSRESARSAPLYVNGNLVMVFQDSPVSFDIQYREFHSIVELSLITGNLFRVNLKSYGISLLYDGVRILAYIPNDLRAQAAGLCGTFTGESGDDFKDPDSLFQRDPRLFAASYADVRYQCEGPAKTDNALSKEVPRFPEEILVFNVAGDEALRSTVGESSVPPGGRCKSQYVDVVYNGSAYCFSQTVLQKCGGYCVASEYDTVSVKYHCVTGRSARYWKSLVDNGGKPDFSRKATSSVLAKRVHKACVFSPSVPRSKTGNVTGFRDLE